MAKYTTVGGTKVRMEPEEIRVTKTRFPTGLVLLGFKPIDKIEQELFIDPASFLYPNEAMIKGMIFVHIFLENR